LPHLPRFSRLHSLDPAAAMDHIAAAKRQRDDRDTRTMDATVQKPRRIVWMNVLTVVSAAILIGAEVFGGAFAAGWAFATLFNLGEYGVYVLQAVFILIGAYAMVRFVANARRVEPFTER
jgi:hypothetical protein